MNESFIVVKAGRVLRATKRHASFAEAHNEAVRLSIEQPRDTFLVFQQVEVVFPRDAEGDGALEGGA